MAQSYSEKAQKILTISYVSGFAFFEVFDLQAPGIAAKGIAASFGLDQIQMGYVFSCRCLRECCLAHSLVDVLQIIQDKRKS